MKRFILCLLLIAGAHSLAGVSEQPVSLSGDWRFEIADANARGFARELTWKIHLPGTIDDAVSVSADGKSWGKPVAQGTFPRKDDLRTIRFAQPVEPRFVRFLAVNRFDPDKPFASLAELSAIVQP